MILLDLHALLLLNIWSSCLKFTMESIRVYIIHNRCESYLVYTAILHTNGQGVSLLMSHLDYEKKNYTTLLVHFRSKTQIILITTVSGVAFAIISRGKTTHFCFKITIDAIESNQCTMSKQSRVAQLLHKPQLFLLDETPMTKTIAIKNIDKLLKDVMENDEDFGGKMVVFCEDIRQVLTVVPKVTIYQTIFASLVKLYLLPKMKNKIILSRNMSRRMIQTSVSFYLELKNVRNQVILINGMQDFKNNVIDGDIVFGQHIGKLVFIPGVPLSLAENEVYPFQFRYEQFYMKLCFVMTINKVQGQTILNVGVYLPNSVFSQCQLYIVISRETSISMTNS
ncbi:hypothetical protein Pfo_000534 [Paulownia fortunei]|nr:hypothetical protein Pfo_000534 [Paulownia fortunei]